MAIQFILPEAWIYKLIKIAINSLTRLFHVRHFIIEKNFYILHKNSFFFEIRSKCIKNS